MKAYALGAAPTVKTHPARAARVALMHTWLSTQTEGWWRYAFDNMELPYEYISVQDVAKDANLRAKYDVIMFAPGGGGGQAIIDGMPMWRNPMPWKNSPETPNIGTYAQTDDVRPGLGWNGLAHLEEFVRQGGVFIAAASSANFAVQYGLTHGVTTNAAGHGLARRRFAPADANRGRHEPDRLRRAGPARGLQRQRRELQRELPAPAAAAGAAGAPPRTRATGRGTPDDPDIAQGRPVLDARNELPERPAAPRPWQYALPTEEQLRNPLNIIPPEFRPRVALRFADQNELLVSGLLQGGGDIAQRPVVVDVPVGQGHVVIFANNPVWRGETIGSYALVWNTILNFDHLNAGRKLDAK